MWFVMQEALGGAVSPEQEQEWPGSSILETGFHVTQAFVIITASIRAREGTDDWGLSSIPRIRKYVHKICGLHDSYGLHF